MCGSTARCSKVNKHARLVERKVCFVSNASNWGGEEWWISVQRPPPPSDHWQPVGQEFYRQKEGATCRNSTISSDSHLPSSRVHLFPFLWSQFSELWQLMFWVQLRHHVVNFSTWCFSISKTAHRIWLRILSTALEKELKVLGWGEQGPYCPAPFHYDKIYLIKCQ